jgi:transposase
VGAALPHPRLRQTRPIDHRHRAGIQATLLHDLSNGLIESVNTRIRLLTRITFGFKSPEALIGLAMLSVGRLYPPLSDRALPTHG